MSSPYHRQIQNEKPPQRPEASKPPAQNVANIAKQSAQNLLRNLSLKKLVRK